eukprot:UN26438
MGVPINSISFSATLSTIFGDADVQLWAISDEGSIECLIGATQGCQMSDPRSTIDGMDITFSGGDSSPPVTESIFIDTTTEFTTLRVYAQTATQGTVNIQSNGIAPCGEDTILCIEPPRQHR